MSDSGCLLTAYFHLYTENFYEARKYVQRVLPPNKKPSRPIEIQAASLAAWVEVSSNGTSRRELDELNDAIETLNDPALSKDLDSLMVKAKHYEQQGRQKLALDQLNQAIAIHSWFTPALVEKAKLFIASGEFDQASEMSQRIVNQSNDQNSFDAIMISTLIDVVHQGKDVVENFRRLVMSISRNER